MRPPPSTSPFIHLDPRQRGGLQTQIYQSVRGAILDGRLAPGARLLSSRALADDLDVSRTTTLLAYEQLTAEGYLTARHGSGTFVGLELPDDPPQTRTRRRRQTATHPALSARGRALAEMPSAAWRIPGPPRAFRIGVPALDRFPHQVWTQLVTRRARAATLAQLDYGHVAGQPALREAIAAHVSGSRGTSCTGDQVIVVAGAQGGLELVFRALLDPGDVAVIEQPGYPGVWSALAAAGAVTRAVRVDEHGIDVDALRSVRGRPRLAYVTPSHQFPLGVPMSLPRRLSLLRWARDAGAWIVEDDYDSEFRHGARPVPCLHGLARDERVIYVSSFSKTLFPALRLGFVIVPPDLATIVAAIRRAADLRPPSLDQLVVADLIADGHYERHLRRMRGLYRERLEALQYGLRRWCVGALSPRPTQTGLHVVADLADDLESDAVMQAAMTQQIELMPLSAYYLGRSRPPSALVLGFGAVDPRGVLRGTEALARAIDASRQPGRTPRQSRMRDATIAVGRPIPSM